MKASKCPKCGFVSARDGERCKRCGVAIKNTSSFQKEASGSRRFIILAISIAFAVVVVLAGSAIVLAMFGGKKPSPDEVASLLSADNLVTRPINLTLMNEFSTTETNEKMSEEYAIHNYVEGRVFKQLGLATTTFTVTKAEKQKCYRYNKQLRTQLDYQANYNAYGEDPAYIRIATPNGEFEQCDDAWDYHIQFNFDDFASLDRALLAERIQYVTDINEQPPPSVRADVGDINVQPPPSVRTDVGPEWPRWQSVPIGAIEIVEVSDVISGSKPDAYSVGFKFRFKPSALGELYDLTSSIHKSLPPGVRRLFANVPKHDQRFEYFDRDGLTFGYAELTSSGLFSRRWKIETVYFKLTEDAKQKYTFHHIK